MPWLAVVMLSLYPELSQSGPDQQSLVESNMCTLHHLHKHKEHTVTDTLFASYTMANGFAIYSSIFHISYRFRCVLYGPIESAASK